jgi:hypothetical protein
VSAQPIGTLRMPGAPSGELAAPPTTPRLDGARELFVRHARKDGRSVAVLRAFEFADRCVVEADVFPGGVAEPTAAGPYTFADAHGATAFVTDAVEALMYLGCDIQAQ